MPYGTSTTPNTIGAGVFSFTTQAGLGFVVGASVVAGARTAPVNYLTGTVAYYGGTTLSITVTGFQGSGTFADWILTDPATPPLAASQGSLVQWAVTICYKGHDGLYGVPPASPRSTPNEIQRLHAATAKKWVTWAAQCAGGRPTLPSRNTQNPNEVLQTWEISPCVQGRFPDGNQAWTVFGQYVYLLQMAPTEADILAVGVDPRDPNVAIQFLSGADFNARFLGPGNNNVQGFTAPTITY